MYYEIVTCV